MPAFRKRRRRKKERKKEVQQLFLRSSPQILNNISRLNSAEEPWTTILSFVRRRLNREKVSSLVQEKCAIYAIRVCTYIRKAKKASHLCICQRLNQMFLFVHDCIIIRLCLLYLFFKDLHTVFTYLSLKTPKPGGAVSHTQLLHM